jgi:flagellar hook-associated protein 2
MSTSSISSTSDSATFRAGGLMSGLDTNTIIEQLVALEKVPITKLQTKQATLTQQKSLISQIESIMSTLDTSLSAINTNDKLLSYQCTSSNTAALTATATGNVVQGNHTVKVVQLANAEQDRSTAFASAATPVKAGTLTITVQGEDPVNVTIGEGATLADVAYAINTSNAKVSAAVIDTGTDQYLTLYADDLGYDIGSTPSDAVKLQETYTGTTGQELGFSEIVTAQNAKVEFDGLTVERRDNTITNIIPGLTLNLLSDDGQPTTTVKIAADEDGMLTKINGFVSAYNNLITLLNTQFKAPDTSSSLSGGTQDSDPSQDAGVLFGDSTLRGLMMQVKSVISDTIDGVVGQFSSLGLVGITTGDDGTLSVDSTKFSSAVSKDFECIANLFTTDTNGICDKLSSTMKGYTDVTEGMFKYKIDSINQSYDQLSEQISRMEDRVNAYQDQLIQEFTTMETTISNLKSQQSYITAISGSSSS